MLLYTRLLLHLLTKGEATLALLVLYLIPMKPSVLWLWLLLLHLIPRLLLVLLLWRRRSLIVGHCSHGLLVV